MVPFELRTIPIHELRLAPYNPRRPLTKPARQKLRKSLQEFGLVEPLVWNARTQLLVGGHARLEILKELGYTEVPVSVVNLDDDRERALNIMLNNLEAQGRYDSGKLLLLLKELGDSSPLTGFDDSTIRCLQLEPHPEFCQPVDSSHVEIILSVERDRLDEVYSRLEPLTREWDLDVHIRACGVIR